MDLQLERGYGVASARGAWMQWEQLNMATKNVQGESAVAIRRRCNDARTTWSVEVDKQDRTYIWLASPGQDSSMLDAGDRLPPMLFS